MAGATLVLEPSGTARSRVLQAYVGRRLRRALGVFRFGPVAACVAFKNRNGPKGGVADRCALTVRMPYRPAVHVEHTAPSPRAAFNGVFDALTRALAGYRERGRDRRRFPKKIFAAAGVLAGDVARPPRAKRLRRRRIA